MILIDTSVWIDHFRSAISPEAEWLATAIGDGKRLCTNGMIVTEVLQGVDTDREFRSVEHALGGLLYLPMSRQTHVLAADIYRRARRRGKTVRSPVDCMIAACAIANGVPLLQKDRDFLAIADVSGLQMIAV